MAWPRRPRAALALAVAVGALAAAPGGPVAGVATARAGDIHLPAATVRGLQRKLGVQADGIYGPRTRAAVRRFQRRHGLLVDGIAGPQTLGALGLTAGAGGSADSSGSGAAASTGAGGAAGAGPRGPPPPRPPPPPAR